MKELVFAELAAMTSEQLHRYIGDRLRMNNYREAGRATAALSLRLSSPRGAPLVERFADAIVMAHIDGQGIGEARYEKALTALLDVCIAMDAEHQDERPDENEYRRVVSEAALALGRDLPVSLLDAWEAQP